MLSANVPLDCQISAAGHGRSGLRAASAGADCPAGSHALHASGKVRARAAVCNAMPWDGECEAGSARSLVSSRGHLLSESLLLRFDHIGVGAACFESFRLRSPDRTHSPASEPNSSSKRAFSAGFCARPSALRTQNCKLANPANTPDFHASVPSRASLRFREFSASLERCSDTKPEWNCSAAF